MSKQKPSDTPKKPRGRPRKTPAPAPVAPAPAAPAPVTTVVHTQTHFDYQQPVGAPPYPLPSDVNSTQTTTTGQIGPVNQWTGGDLSDMTQSMNDAKSLWKSKNFWGAVSLFGLSALTVAGTIPAIANSPVIMGVSGMAFAILWIAFRFMTNQAITPSINIPHPSEWFKKKS